MSCKGPGTVLQPPEASREPQSTDSSVSLTRRKIRMEGEGKKEKERESREMA